MNNLELYNKVREVPKEAQKPFDNGRFKGTDINPMWRIKTLTEQFGACGIGWYYEITDKWTETVENAQDVMCFVTINLYIKDGDGWSKPISGIGGSKIADMTRKGLYIDDEGFKKASTDAISVACKNLGIGADIYWGDDSDKYIDPKKESFEPNEKPASTSNSKASTVSNKNEQTDALSKEIAKYAKEHGMTMAEIAKDYQLNNKTATAERLQEVLNDLRSGEQTSMMDDFAAIDEEVPF